MNNRQTGSRYEDMAAAYLQENGYEIIERNFRCDLGEIDIIARDGIYICFVEVKYRAGISNGFPSEAVGSRKQKVIFNCASVYMKKNGIPFSSPCRFDVVAILGSRIKLYKNAFGSF